MPNAVPCTPSIFGSGDGGEGTDNWSFVANIGYHPEETREYYNHEGHAIYKGLEFKAEANPGWNHNSCLLIGPGTREDHNCMWDLNAYSYTAEGANTVEKFEADNNCQIIGTWGHVQDYAVAGLIEFYPATATAGTIIANGLAAYEWSPRQGTNAFHSNITLLTANTINYLTKNSSAAIDIEAPAAEGAVRFFNLQGVEITGELTPGLYIRQQGNTASKVLVK